MLRREAPSDEVDRVWRQLLPLLELSAGPLKPANPGEACGRLIAEQSALEVARGAAGDRLTDLLKRISLQRAIAGLASSRSSDWIDSSPRRRRWRRRPKACRKACLARSRPCCGPLPAQGSVAPSQREERAMAQAVTIGLDSAKSVSQRPGRWKRPAHRRGDPCNVLVVRAQQDAASDSAV